MFPAFSLCLGDSAKGPYAMSKFVCCLHGGYNDATAPSFDCKDDKYTQNLAPFASTDSILLVEASKSVICSSH